MDLFQEYTSMLESVIERELKMRIADFEMDDFLALLTDYYHSSEYKQTKNNNNNNNNNNDNNDGAQCFQEEERTESEIFELLLTMTDFDHFKEFMLDCRNGDETELGVDFSLKGDGLGMGMGMGIEVKRNMFDDNAQNNKPVWDNNNNINNISNSTTNPKEGNTNNDNNNNNNVFQQLL